MKAASFSGQETQETTEASEPLHLFWFPGKPQHDSGERRLLHELTSRGLLVEPFERAAIGLKEVYQTKGDAAT